LVASGGEDCILKIWNASTGAVFRNYGGHGDAITAVEFSPLDHNLIVSASRDASIRVWHMDTSSTMAMLTGHSDAITSLAFSSDGWLLASGSADATCKVLTVSLGLAVHFASNGLRPLGMECCQLRRAQGVLWTQKLGVWL
jgi:WD40 repeat protein